MRFRTDNTEGYSAEQLKILNGWYEAEIAERAAAGEEIHKSLEDYVAAWVQYEFDAKG